MRRKLQEKSELVGGSLLVYGEATIVSGGSDRSLLYLPDFRTLCLETYLTYIRAFGYYSSELKNRYTPHWMEPSLLVLCKNISLIL